MPSEMTQRIRKLLGGDLYMHGWEDSWMQRHAVGSPAKIQPIAKIAETARQPLRTYSIEDHRGALVFSIREANNPDRTLAAYRGALGPEDFPGAFEREAIGDWWRVRRGVHLP